MPAFDKILVPIDFSEPSEHALGYAIALARKLGASIELIHCYELPVLASPDGAIIAGPELVRRIMDQAGESLAKAVEAHKSDGVAITSHLTQGPAHSAIVEHARALPADLIVIGTHGRTGLQRLLLGSVAERVVRTSDVPVLSVQPPEK
jgi:nucleotide-binding universal stress UspA family protein